MVASLAHDECFFESPVDKTELLARRWKSKDAAASARGYVLIAHGYNEHSGRYEKVAAPLVERGYHVFAMDHRSQGRSKCPRNRRAWFDTFEFVVRDFADFVRRVAASRGDAAEELSSLLLHDRAADSGPADAAPMYILGHSMGGLVTTCLVTKYLAAMFPGGNPVRGVVLSSPFLEMPGGTSCVSLTLLRFLAWLSPTLALPPIDDTLISRAHDEVEKYNTDPLNVRNGVTTHAVVTFAAAHADVNKFLKEFNLPLLIIFGSDDRVVDISGAERLLKKCTSADKHMSVYDGGFHELFNEVPDMAARALKEVVAWIEERTPARGPMSKM